MTTTASRFPLSLLIAAALTACGGGGTDAATGSPAPTPQTPQTPTPTTPPPTAAGFSFTLDTGKAIVWQGQQASVAVAVQRDAGFTDAIQFSAEGMPAGATTAALSVPAGSNAGTLTLQAATTAPHSLPTSVTIKGAGGTANASKPLTVTVRGQAGDIDTSFGGGTLVTPGGITDDYVRGVTVQADGKAVVAGFGVFGSTTGTDFMVVRHLRDGGLDPSFGNGGKVSTAFNNGGRSDEAQAVAVQADGKILVAGSSDQGASGYDFALARYNADGTLDTTFGSGGRVTTSFGNGADKAYALLLQPDGKIVLGGDSSQGANGSDFALARYNADGSLDASFGNGGKVLTAIGSDGARETIYALALQTAAGVSRIVAAGGEGDFIAAAYRADGTLDAGFGTAGIVRSLFGSITGAARGVVVTADGKLVLAGHRDHDFAAVRLLPNGNLDTSFGTGGRAVVAVSADNWDEATALVQQADGRLLLGGWMYTGNSSSADTVLLRLNADGSRDTGFSPNGIRVTAVASGVRTDSGRALALQPDERVPTVRVLQAGEAGGNSDLDIVLMRHWL
ncbi:delta-60 repeat domain-containing protein [Roseateles sp. P5_D6]